MTLQSEFWQFKLTLGECQGECIGKYFGKYFGRYFGEYIDEYLGGKCGKSRIVIIGLVANWCFDIIFFRSGRPK